MLRVLLNMSKVFRHQILRKTTYALWDATVEVVSGFHPRCTYTRGEPV